MSNNNSKADRALIWLGTYSKDSISAVETLTSLSSLTEMDWQVNAVKPPSSVQGDHKDWPNWQIDLQHDEKTWSSILSWSWFQRV